MQKASKNLLFFILFACSFSTISSYERTEEREQLIDHAEKIVQRAQETLPQTGVLKEAGDGFVYLKVDDDYINQLYPMLVNHNYSKPPYFRRSDSPGAHASVFYVDERNQTGTINEIGQKYAFKVTGLIAVPPKNPRYIVLEISSPELEQLRQKYGLSPLLKNHQFHITIATKSHGHHHNGH